MGKVITSAGMQDFVQNGTITHVPDHKSGTGAVPPLETKPAEKVAEVGEQKTSQTEAKAPEPLDEGLEAEDKDLSEAIRKKIGKKHRAMKEAQEAASDAETFAKTQYERARLAEERAAELERRLNEKPAEKPPEVKEPDVADFTKDGQVDWIAYTKATNEYTKRQAIEEFKAEQARERAESDQKQRSERLRASADDARKVHSDFDEVMGELSRTQADLVPQFVLTYIEESGNPGEVSYYLAKHPEDRERIAKLSPIRGIAELGKLEDKLTSGTAPAKAPVAEVKTPERGGAPPPITPISTTGSGSVNTDPSKMNYRELREYERSRRKPR